MKPRDWYVDEDPRVDGANQIIDRATGHTVAFVATGVSPAEHDARSYLLAAAPDLYAALRFVLLTGDGEGHEILCVCPALNEPGPHSTDCEQARRALAKADGGSR